MSNNSTPSIVSAFVTTHAPKIPSKAGLDLFFYNLRHDLKERFLKFETVHGLFLVGSASAGVFITIFYLQYILHVLGLIIFGSGIIYGLYAIFHNPIAKKMVVHNYLAHRVARTQAANSPGTPPSSDTNSTALDTPPATLVSDLVNKVRQKIADVIAPTSVDTTSKGETQATNSNNTTNKTPN